MGLEWKNNLGFMLFGTAKHKVKTGQSPVRETPSHGRPGEVCPCEPEEEPSFLELGVSLYAVERKMEPALSQEAPDEKEEAPDLSANDTAGPGETWDLSLETNFLGSIFTSHKVVPTTRNFWDEVLSPDVCSLEKLEGDTKERRRECGTVFFEKGTNEYQLVHEAPFIPRAFKLQPAPKKAVVVGKEAVAAGKEAVEPPKRAGVALEKAAAYPNEQKLPIVFNSEKLSGCVLMTGGRC